MTVVDYKHLKQHLDGINRNAGKGADSPVYLIYGEELLYKKAFGALLDTLLPQADKSLNYEPVDGDLEEVSETMEKMNTYSLLSGRKVVAVHGSKIFYSADDRQMLVDKAKASFASDDIKTAAKHTLDLLGLANISYEDISPENPAASMKLDLEGLDDGEWLAKTIEYCVAQRLVIPDRRDRGDLLQQAIERGFPAGNCLIITTEQVDKRRSLYKAIDQAGVVIDCSVPKGDRRADRSAQDAVLTRQMTAILADSGKKMAAGAYQTLIEMTGFDLRTFSNSIEKLISYTGDSKEITAADVESLLLRTKKDPIYELTNSVAERHLAAALFFTRSLLDDGLHPLQILAAVVNQVRKLLLVKDFATSEAGGAWQPGMSFERFRSRVLPVLQDFDQALLDIIDKWRFEKESKKNRRKKSQAKPKTDLLLVRNPANSYPVYILLQKSENFSKAELVSAMKILNETDLLLKSSPLNPLLILEKALLSICRTS